MRIIGVSVVYYSKNIHYYCIIIHFYVMAMKKMYIFSGWMALILILLSLVSSALGSVQIVVGDESNDFFEFVTAKWAIIALVISEVAAFLPAKANGIAHATLRILTSIFSRK